ncbi:ATPase, T2SS/T4P/T4SS family [Paraburkholderia sp. A1RI-2L]|uniref:ATPase, T2SS/T4P/T4SS family n=1 Tax=Paraburkholderia sp. A1RI-2L TaxID=3028367 RepID=UPI003B76BAC3
MSVLKIRGKEPLFQDDTAEKVASRAVKPITVPELPRDLQQHVVYRRTMGRAFGEVAVDLGLLTAAQVKELLFHQQDDGGKIGEIAKSLDMLNDEQIEQVLGAQAMTVHVDSRHSSSPSFLTWINDVSKCGAAPNIVKHTAQELEALRQENAASADEGDTDLATLNLGKRIIHDAAAMNVSDLTVLIRETHAEIQMRVKGDNKLAPSYTMRREEGQALIRSIYNGLTTTKASFIPNEFQDANIHGDAFPGTGLSSIRIIRGPAYPVDSGGGFLIARLQYRKHASRSTTPTRPVALKTPHKPAGKFHVPGFTPLQYRLVEELVRVPMGVIAVTGPTGSGKTTTIYEIMKYQAQTAPEKRQITIENPPEYPYDWAIQLAAGDDDFREFLRYALRMDPDTILMGEVRKADEGVAAMQAALTGHTVLMTVHVTDPYKTLTRLEGLDKDRLSMATICDHELIVGLMAQRVVPILCPECAPSLHERDGYLPQYLMNTLATWGDLKKVRVRGPGCPTCNHDGIVSREAVAEIVLTTEEFMADVVNHGLLAARRNQRMRPGADKSMLGNAMDRVFAGEIDPADVQKEMRIVEKGDGV